MSPTTNPFFNSTYPGQSTEQNLIDSLVIEQIAIYGLDVLYIIFLIALKFYQAWHLNNQFVFSLKSTQKLVHIH